MKICPECKEENSDNARFCENCGTNLSDAPVKDAEASTKTGGIMGWWNSQGTGVKIVSVVGVCCVGLIIVGLIAAMMLPDMTSSNNTSVPANNSTDNITKNTTQSTSSNPSSSSSSSPSSASGATVTQIRVSYDGQWQGAYGDETGWITVEGTGTETYTLDGTNEGVGATFEKTDMQPGTLTVDIIQDGVVKRSKSTSVQYGAVVSVFL